MNHAEATMTTAKRTMAKRSGWRCPPLARTAVVATLLAALVLAPASARAQPAAAPTPGAPAPAPPEAPAPPVVGGASPSVDIVPSPPMPPPPAPAPPPPPPTALSPSPPPPAAMTGEPLPGALSPPSRLTSYILWGAAGASIIVGASFGIATLSAKSDFDDNPSSGRADTVHNRA